MPITMAMVRADRPLLLNQGRAARLLATHAMAPHSSRPGMSCLPAVNHEWLPDGEREEVAWDMDLWARLALPPPHGWESRHRLSGNVATIEIFLIFV